MCLKKVKKGLTFESSLIILKYIESNFDGNEGICFPVLENIISEFGKFSYNTIMNTSADPQIESKRESSFEFLSYFKKISNQMIKSQNSFSKQFSTFIETYKFLLK